MRALPGLAPAYSREANQTCEGRYRDIVRRVARRPRARPSSWAAAATRCSTPSALRLGGLRPLHRHAAAAQTIARTAAVVGAGELPFRDGAFDGMYSINVIEHVADVEAVVAEGASSGRPGFWPR